MPSDQNVDVDGRRLKLTNLDKVLYPTAGFTKGQIIDYYARIAPVLVPHLKDRPLTLKRYPGGVDQQYFFEKNATKHRPDWVKTAPIWSEGNRRDVNYILANDLPTLVWIANLAGIELHPSLSYASDIMCPRQLVFDLDPGTPANIVQCCQVAMWLRAIFEHFGLQSFPKTSGSKGLQIYVPLNTKTSYDETKPFAHAMARLLEVLERVETMGDLFAPVLELKQKLPKLSGIAEGKAEAIATGLEIAAQTDKPARAKPVKTQRSTSTRKPRQKV